jgi:hypothetical protein
MGTTLPCKAWSFTEGFKPGHHIHEYSQMFPRQPMKYEETFGYTHGAEPPQRFLVSRSILVLFITTSVINWSYEEQE